MDQNLNKVYDKYLKTWACFIKNNQTENNLENYKKLNEKYFNLVEQSLHQLDEQHRTVITLRYIEKLSWDCIAFRTHFSRRTCFYVRRDVFKKIQELEKILCT